MFPIRFSLFQIETGAGKDPFHLKPVGHENVFQHDVRAEDLTCPRVDETRTVAPKRRIGRGGPAQDVVADVAGVPIGVVGLHLDHQGVLETGRLEGLVPGQRRIADRIPQFQRGCVLDPPHDRLDRIGELRILLLFHQVPAVDKIAVRRRARGSQIRHLLGKVADSRVIKTRPVIVDRHLDQRVLHLDADVARVGDFVAAAHQRRGILIDVIHHHVRVERIALQAAVFGFFLAQCAQVERLAGFGLGIGRGLHLIETLAEKNRVGLDEVLALGPVFGDDLLAHQHRRTDVGRGRAFQGVRLIKIKRGVLRDEFDPVEMFAE